MNNDHPVLAFVIVYMGTALSWITLSHLVALATLIFTVLQIGIAVRKLFRGTE